MSTKVVTRRPHGCWFTQYCFNHMTQCGFKCGISCPKKTWTENAKVLKAEK